MLVNPNEEKKKVTLQEAVEHFTLCGKDVHNMDGCFKRIGYPDCWPYKGKQEIQKPTVVGIEMEASPIPGMIVAQYQQFVNFLGNKDGVDKDEITPVANMAGHIGKEGK